MSINAYNINRLRERSFLVEDRVKSVDYFIGDIEKDIERGSYIASFRALLGIQQHITSTGEYLSDLDSVFTEILVNGTINSSYVSVMNDTELNKWIDKIRYEASKYSISFDYDIVDVELVHIDPWVVETRLNVILNISDTRGTSRWIRNQTINSTLGIELYEDPVYTINTLGRVINVIQETNITDFVTGNETSNLTYHVENSIYKASNSSPSYLMRLEGDFGSSCYGIESFVNLRKLETAGFIIEDKSCIDYIYFSVDDPQSWAINHTFNWLRIDNESNHLAIYEVVNITG
ncbi:hypothetical protein JXB31_04710 [Candidatus Woesearchaeota archaeon]|nr:hypothetical protein [Candidatus Woesearchaeota archaeon]